MFQTFISDGIFSGLAFIVLDIEQIIVGDFGRLFIFEDKEGKALCASL
jgi:hypothetical protein